VQGQRQGRGRRAGPAGEGRGGPSPVRRLLPEVRDCGQPAAEGYVDGSADPARYPRNSTSARQALSNSPRCRLSFSEWALPSGSSTPVRRSAASGYALASAGTNGIDPPAPMSTGGPPHAPWHAFRNASNAGPRASTRYGAPAPPGITRRSAPQGAFASRCFVRASMARAGSSPGARRRLTLARAEGTSWFVASLILGASIPSTETEGRV